MNLPYIAIETASDCNRKCASCLRQAYPDRDRIAGWFSQNYLPRETIHRLYEELRELGFRDVCLSGYNEATMDHRLPDLARKAREAGFVNVTTITNGDLLAEDMAASLDGALTGLTVSLYGGRRTEKRIRLLKSWFSKTKLSFNRGRHRHTHYSCLPGLDEKIAHFQMRPCSMPSYKVRINHLGDALACCEEIVSEFGIGNVHDMHIRDIIFGDKRRELIETLSQPGGRLAYPYCRICPAYTKRHQFVVEPAFKPKKSALVQQ